MIRKRPRKVARRLGMAAAICALLELTACSAANFDIAGASSNEARYVASYPEFLEYCAVSEIRKKPGFGTLIVGGTGGHAAFYLNGACRVPGQGYPVLGMCDQLPGAGVGVGVSMDGNFSNATWVATPGRAFFFNGGLKPGERLTRARYQQVQDEARRLGILDGIRFDPTVFADQPAGMSREDYKYDISIGTDYGIALARGRYCARVPVSHQQMTKIVDSLNAINTRFRYGPETYQAGVFQDNCVHLPHNALAAADFWKDWPTGAFLLFAIFDFPVPKNEFVNVMWRSNDLPIDDPLAIYNDGAARRELLDYDRLPTEPGALAYSAPAWRDNDVYDTDLGLIFFDQPLLGDYQPRFDKIFSTPRYYDLDANHAYFEDLYKRIAANRKPVEWWLTRLGPASRSRRQDFRKFYDRYYAYVREQQAKG